MAELLIGIDGGGSKTDFLLCDAEYNELGRYFAPRSNPNDIGIENTCLLIKGGIKELLGGARIKKEAISAAFAGIAGASSSDNAKRIRQALNEALPSAKCDALHDGINVLYGAFPEEDGVSIICGTGSSCFVKVGKEIHRIGGYGSFDLSGNGYEIGRKAIAHALKTIDGREEKGILEELIGEKIGDDFLKALDGLVKMNKTELAAFAPTVFKAASLGDKAALGIITESVEYIAELIKQAGKFFENSYNVALAGGIFKNDIAFELLKTKVEKRVILEICEKDQSFGAAARAKQLLTEE